MVNALAGVLKFALFPAGALIAGGLIALVRQPSVGMRSAVQHLAAGVIFCVLATELLPDLVHRRMPWVTVLGFAAGVATMLSIRSLNEKMEADSATVRLVSGFLLALGIDILVDGALIGLSFAAGQKQGLLLTIALVLEVFFLGVSCSTSLAGDKVKRTRIFGTLFILSLILLLGAGGGAIALTTVRPAVLDAFLAFGVAALLYLVTEELLVEAHEGPEKPVFAAMFFVGFIIIFVIDMLI